MSDQRGVTVVELLIASFVIGIVAAGLTSAYLMTARAYGDSNANVMVQRQGMLALEEISRRVRSASGANAIGVAPCNGRPGSLQLDTPGGRYCYYADTAAAPDVKLCEFTAAGGCRNLLAGGLGNIAVMRQPTPPDPSCPEEVLAGGPCLAVKTANSNRAEVTFTLVALDSRAGAPLRGTRPIPFRISLTCSGRNC